MNDVFSKEKRSAVMRQVKASGNKSTELKLITEMRKGGVKGWRRRWPLPGKPDFTFPKERLCVFVDGCFWHGCPRCYGGENPKRKMPASNADYWSRKIAANIKRDRKVSLLLRTRGYAVLRVRECELRYEGKARSRILRKLRQRQMLKNAEEKGAERKPNSARREMAPTAAREGG